MKIITSQQMYELEQAALKKFSIKQGILMENAGKGVAKWIEEFTAGKKLPKNILIVSGRGNNGGDSFAAARYLFEAGFNVELILLGKETDIKGIAKSNYSKLKKKKKVKIYKAVSPEQFYKIKDVFNNHDLILDGILGAGIKGEIKGFIKEIVEYINNSFKTVISIDIPSGMDANTGAWPCINAYTTLTMGLPKIGLLKPEAENKVGHLHVIDIGLPKKLEEDIKTSFEYLCRQDFLGMVPKRPIDSHKGLFGHVLILAGSPNYTGAGVLCAMGALKSGAGLVTIGVPASLQGIYQNKMLEVMTLPLAETEDNTLSEEAADEIINFLEKVDCVALGPGLTTHHDTIRLVKKIISKSDKPVIIDADGVNSIAEELLILRKAKAPLVLTPHPGELARLLHTSPKGVINDKWKISRELADKYGVIILIKGAHSVVAGNDKKIYINSSGNPGMASGGMGDVLTGIIASLIAQGFKALSAVKLGMYMHGVAGDMVAGERGEWGILANDVLEKLPYVMNDLYGK